MESNEGSTKVLKSWTKRVPRAGILSLVAMAAILMLAVACGDDATATPGPTVASTDVPADPGSATPTAAAAAVTPQPATQPAITPGVTNFFTPTAVLEPTPASAFTPVLPTPAPTPAAPPTPTPTPSHYPLTVTDSNGEEVVFEEAPNKIVALDSAVVEFLFAMGEGDRIVATHDFLTYPPEAVDLPRVGSAFQVNAERILELDPDLITVFFASAVDAVSGLGIPVLYIETPQDVQGIPEQIQMWGAIVNNPEAAGRVTEKFDSRLAMILEKLADVEEGPRVFHDDSLFYTSGPDTFVGNAYTLLKAQNIANDLPAPYGQLSPEVIVERDPEVIVATFSNIPQEYLDNPAFENVSAVKNNRIPVVEPDGILSVAGTRFLEGVEWLAKALYPDLFGDELGYE